MKTLTDQLAQYASYHRDRRNILSHFLGIPMIVLSVSTLLSRPVMGALPLPLLGPLALTPALLAALLAGLFYLRLDWRYGLVMAAWLALSNHAGGLLAHLPIGTWLAWGLGLFVVGWIIQFIGHWYEGRKPAFVDDLIGLAVGPLFVVAEAGFLLGLRRDVLRAVQARAGATR